MERPRGAARSRPRRLEGFHALKHALRFGAEILEVEAGDPERLETLAARSRPTSQAASASSPPRRASRATRS